MSLLTGLRTKCYDPAGVGCCFFNRLLTVPDGLRFQIFRVHPRPFVV